MIKFIQKTLVIFLVLIFLAVNVSAEGTEIIVTFGGDCTLGSEDKYWEKESSFIQYIEKYGFEYPFVNLKPIFESDDITMVNLEGVFHDSKRGKLKKTYNFRAPSTYAQILPLASIEAVTLGNNHSMDYDRHGFEATTAALDNFGVEWFVNCRYTNKGYLYQKNGAKIGFVGVYIGDWRRQPSFVRGTIDELKSKGAKAIVGIIHGGTEYSLRHDSNQEKMADWLIKEGVSVVIGHHPHVVQGVNIKGSTSIVYSLGNLSFGGNDRIKEHAGDALLARTSFYFDAVGNYTGHRIWLIPIHPSSAGGLVNNYQPVLANAEEANRILAVVQNDTPFTLSPYVLGEGCALPFVPAAGTIN
jgi:hypothetical protein